MNLFELHPLRNHFTILSKILSKTISVRTYFAFTLANVRDYLSVIEVFQFFITRQRNMFLQIQFYYILNFTKSAKITRVNSMHCVILRLNKDSELFLHNRSQSASLVTAPFSWHTGLLYIPREQTAFKVKSMNVLIHL